MQTQFVILVKEQLVIGAEKIAPRIGYHPNDIKKLVKTGRLKAWQSKPNGKWKTLPEYIDQFNQAEAVRFGPQ